MKIKTNQTTRKTSTTTSRIKEATKQQPINLNAATSTTTNAKTVPTTKTTTSSTTTETPPTTAPTAFEALKRSILSLFPKNLDMNFNIVKILDGFLKSFNLNSLFHK